MRRAQRVAMLALLTAVSAPAHARAASALGAAPEEADSVIGELEASVARHPDDPDLSWALARTLAEQGDTEAAAIRLAAHLERWPEHPPGAWLVLGRWLQELDRHDEALAALDEALSRDPSSGVAHLHAGLSAKRLGRLELAASHFQRAAELEPELAAEAGLLSGLARLALGDEEGARHVLGEVVAGHRESEAARAALLVLNGSPGGRPPLPLLSLDAYGGVQFDSNVTLESGVDLPGAGGDRDDVRFAWGSGATVRPLRGERFGIDLGLGYDESAHLDFTGYDSRRVLGRLGGRYRITRDLALRLDGWLGYTTLSDDPYLSEGVIRSSFLVDLGRPGLLRLYATGHHYAYEDPPLFRSLERDGWSYGGGFEHIAPIWLREGSYASWSAGYTRRDTEAGRDLLGFHGAYDHDRFGALLQLHVPLVLAVAADASVAFDAERYDNTNVIDALTDDGVGRPDPRRRSDDVWGVGLLLTRPVGRFTELEVSWGYTDRASNVDLYAYDRHVVGLTVRVQTP